MFWLSCDPNQSKTPLPVLTARALVVQLDRIPDYESGGRRFESFRARSFPSKSASYRKYIGQKMSRLSPRDAGFLFEKKYATETNQQLELLKINPTAV